MTYPRSGDSNEVRNLITFALQVPGARISCTTDHAIFTGAGFMSYHRKGGHNGNGLAIDVSGSASAMKAVFVHFLEHRAQLHELIHTPMGYSIKDGRTVGPIDAKHHYNHVHVSIKKTEPPTYFPIPSPTPIDKVKPMYNPPIIKEPIAAACLWPGGGFLEVSVTGAVYAQLGAPYTDAPNNHPEYWNGGRKAAKIEPDGHGGYTVTDTWGETYNYPPKK